MTNHERPVSRNAHERLGEFYVDFREIVFNKRPCRYIRIPTRLYELNQLLLKYAHAHVRTNELKRCLFLHYRYAFVTWKRRFNYTYAFTNQLRFEKNIHRDVFVCVCKCYVIREYTSWGQPNTSDESLSLSRARPPARQPADEETSKKIALPRVFNYLSDLRFSTRLLRTAPERLKFPHYSALRRLWCLRNDSITLYCYRVVSASKTDL